MASPQIAEKKTKGFASNPARPPVPKPDITLEQLARLQATKSIATLQPVKKSAVSPSPAAVTSNPVSNGLPAATLNDPHATAPKSPSNSLPNVVVMVDTGSDQGRSLVRGISSYAVKHGPWNLWLQSSSFPASLSTVADLGGNGIISEFGHETPGMVASGLPVVNVSSRLPAGYRIPTIVGNDVKAASLAVEHFRERGLQNFAYVGPMQNESCQQHAAAFKNAVRNAGFHCDSFDCADELVVPPDWSQRRKEMVDWLSHFSKPLAVFTFGAGSAVQVANACRWADVSVPDHVSVLAGQDDDLLCSTMTPTLSAVKTASEQIGYEAARQLDNAIHGRPSDAGVTEIDPVLVCSRQSTEAIAINDPDLLAAVRFIREHACGGINVQEVADSVPIGRRSLERKFKEHFGRTPLDEIQRLRLGRVRELLIKTDLPVSRIASDAGFGTPEYMTTMFKSRYGLTPLKFRSQTRAR